ncbi:MAG: GtrA family protein [Gorillibacterium sp.]|nr:GtrA family protein [Gorillibacterium sp.]
MKRLDLLVKYRSFIRFNIVGVLNTLVDFTVFTILFALGVPNSVSQCISYSAGTVNSYVLNRKWTFAAQEKAPLQAKASRRKSIDIVQLSKFLVVNLITLGLSLILLHLFSEVWGQHPLIAKGIAIVFTTLVNFLGSKLWVFSGKPKQTS